MPFIRGFGAGAGDGWVINPSIADNQAPMVAQSRQVSSMSAARVVDVGQQHGGRVTEG